MTCTRATIGILALLGACAGPGKDDAGEPVGDDDDTVVVSGDDDDAATGDDDDDDDDDATEPPATVECYSTDPCDASAEYCLESVINDVQMAGTCAALPEGCHDCDCVLDQDIDAVWQALNDGTDNCSGAWLFCDQQNAAIRVTCSKSAF